MRIVAVALVLLAAAPAVAQESVSRSNTPSARMNSGVWRGQGNSDSYNLLYRDDRRGQRLHDAEVNLRRAGAWGECVAEAAPADSREYLLRQQTTALLRWSFDRCQRKVGEFAGFGMTNIRRAALLDAIRASS